MTPQEIFEYKHKWLSTGRICALVGDWSEYPAKQWCKENVEPHRWHFSKYVSPADEHSFCFEREEDYNAFLKFLNKAD